MQIVKNSNNISIGGTLYPLNSLAFRPEGSDLIKIYLVPNMNPIISAPFGDFIDNTNTPYASQAAVIAALSLSFI